MSALEEGSVIGGRYRLERRLASGGMGSVWVAEHQKLRTTVAIKLMAPSFAESAEARVRFEREAQASAQLKSPNVVQVHDYGVEGDSPYIVMELLDGEDLEARLGRLQRLSLAATSDIVQQVCKALRRAHEMGLVHRDLKPANIFISRHGDEEVVKILDFGIAKATGPLMAGKATKTGALMGSPQYMSPEQVRRGKELDHRSDLWSLGVIAFRCVTGRLPFTGEELGDLLVEICTDPIPVPSHLAGDLRPEVDRFFERALSRDVGLRYQSARELAEAFAAVAMGHLPQAAPGLATVAAGPATMAANLPPPAGPPANTFAPIAPVSSVSPAAGGTLSPSGHSLVQAPPSSMRTASVLVVAAGVVLALALAAFAFLRSPAPEADPGLATATARAIAGSPGPAALQSAPEIPSALPAASATASAGAAETPGAPTSAPPAKGAPPAKKGTKSGHDPLDHQ